MKKKILLLLMTLPFFMKCEAEVQRGCNMDGKCFYAKGFSGPNFVQDTTIDGNDTSYQTGYVVAGSLGYFFSYGLHVEEEYAYRRNGIQNISFEGQGSSQDGYFQTSSCMTNLFWDLPLCSWGYSFRNVKPFIGSGIGCDFQKMHASNSRIIFDQKWTHFSWQLMTGLVFPVFRKAEITLEYKFHQGGSHFYNQAIGIGLAYKFGCLKKS